MPPIIRDPAAEKIKAARYYHERGFWVVPCNGKKATTKEWQNVRLDIDQIVAILRAKPHYDLAIVLNQSDVIDVEHDRGEEGEAILREMWGGDISPTPTYRAIRGAHRFYLRPAGVPSTAKIELNGLEFRGLSKDAGALAVVPPSKGREWLPGLSLDDVEPAELPEHVVALLRDAGSKSTAPPAGQALSVVEGKRNDYLFKEACALAGRPGYDQAVIFSLLSALNVQVCSPPLPDEEVQAIARSAATKKRPQDGFLEQLVRGMEFWHDLAGNPYATVTQGEHRENWKIGKRVRSCRRFLAREFYRLTGETLSDKDLAELCNLLEGRACFDGPEYPVWRRVAEHEGKFYVDLCDPEWQAIEIDEAGWRLASETPVKFLRAPAMTALAMPVRSADGRSLRDLLSPYLNIHESSWPLIGAWLAAALRPIGPYPILKLSGEQGSAKTTTSRVLRSIVDPSSSPVRAEPRSAPDLMISANNQWVLAYDNLSSLPQDLSDAFCRLSTGGGFATRTLYTDEDETIVEATRPVITTSIEDIATKSDLLDRSLIVELPTIAESERRAEKRFWADFEKDRPAILAALLDVVSSAMRRLPSIEARDDAELSRLADFEQWGTAAEEGLGLAPGEFAEAYRANRADAQAIVLESSPFIASFLQFVARNPVGQYTATALLEKVVQVDYSQQRTKGWPQTPRVVGVILKRAAPSLRRVGVLIEQVKEHNERLWSIDATKYAKTQNTQIRDTSFPLRAACGDGSKPVSRFVAKMRTPSPKGGK